MSTERNSETIADEVAAILAAEPVKAATERLLAAGERNRLLRAVEDIRRKNAFVAVVGSQGTGKSSLLNSLLFPVRTLPIGEGVTTNIVCFVRGAAEEENVRAEVLLRSGETIHLPLTREALEGYMDEGQNPGNELGVASVTCFTQNKLLTNATAFVDTPGLGSLEEWQDSVTMNFAHEISLAICVIRTTPTLRDSEADFLRDIWKLCPEIIFVQNVWQESKDQIEEAQRVNTETLTGIAREYNDPRPIQLFRVNIHEGLEGVTNDKPEKVVSSGLGALRNTLRNRVARGGHRLEAMLQGKQIVKGLETAILQGESESVAAATIDKDAAERLWTKIEAADGKLETITEKHRMQRLKFVTSADDAIRSSKRNVTSRVNEVRNNFIFSQNYENAAVECPKCLKQAAQHELSEFEDKMFAARVLYEAESIGSMDDLARSLDLGVGDVKARPDIPTSTEVAELLGKFSAWTGGMSLGALTGVSAIAFGHAVTAGSTVTAALLAGGMTIPVVGWVIAGTALGVGLFVKEIAKDKKQSAVREAIDSGAKTLIESTTKSIDTEGRRIRDKTLEKVDRAFQAALEQQKKLLKDLREAMDLPERNRETLLATLASMIADLKEAVQAVELSTCFDEAWNKREF